MEEEAEADLRYLTEIGRQSRVARSAVKGFSRNGKFGLLFSAICWSGSAAVFLAFMFSGLYDHEQGVYINWPPIWLYIVSGGWVFYAVTNAINDLYGVIFANTQRTGTIARIASASGSPDGEAERSIDVSGEEFLVPGTIYAELSDGDRVTVTYRVALWGSNKVLNVGRQDVESADSVEVSPPDQFTPSWKTIPWPFRVLLGIMAFALFMGGLTYLLYGSD